MTAGGTSIPEVRRLLAVLAAGKRAAEIGSAFGFGAQALASTAREVVTVELDRERARAAREALGGWKYDLEQAERMLEFLEPGGLTVIDDMTPGYGPDPVRELFFGRPDLVTVEILTTVRHGGAARYLRLRRRLRRRLK